MRLFDFCVFYPIDLMPWGTLNFFSEFFYEDLRNELESNTFDFAILRHIFTFTSQLLDVTRLSLFFRVY